MRHFRGALVLGALSLFAAGPLAAQASIGLKAGLTASTLSGDDADGAKTRTGVSGGIFVNLPLSPNFSIQPEALYMSKGADFDAFDNDEVGSVKLQYIEVPILLKYAFGAGPLRPSLFAGPSIAFKTSCEIEFEGLGSFDCEDDVDVGAVKSTDFGAVAGLGLEYDMGGMSLLADARYGFGLTNIDDTGSDSDVKNRGWTFLAGFSIPLGRTR